LKLFKEISSLRNFLNEKRLNGITKIGFVPTMGAIHEGHISLINASKIQNQLTVCSIFVNPTQFNNTDDLAKYPKPIEDDISLLIENGCDVLFFPEVSEMYLNDEVKKSVDYGNITNYFEGKFRKGHFDGVVMIVKKFFQIIEPDNTYFGQKDYQQCMVVEKLIQENNLHIQLHVCPTLRENDGLAKSSRNVRLTSEEREIATIIPHTLLYIKGALQKKPLKEIIINARKQITEGSKLMKLEYLEIVDAKSLNPLSEINETTHAVALIAAWCGNIRLIDNLILTE
jgi:pantoate--beta-alanine ligase